MCLDQLQAARQALTNGNNRQGLALLEAAAIAAKKAKDASLLEAVLELARQTENTLTGPDRAKAHRTAYAAAQNLRELRGSQQQEAGAQGAEAATVAEHGLLEVRGHNGTIRLDRDFVTIARKGFLARASVGKGDKRIPISQITAVQFKPAGPMVNGFIQFTVAGGLERRSRAGSQTRSAGKDENSVIFWWAQRHQFEALRDAVEQAIGDYHRKLDSPTAVGTGVGPSIPEQISQLGALRDAGLISNEEFETSKQQLLARL